MTAVLTDNNSHGIQELGSYLKQCWNVIKWFISSQFLYLFLSQLSIKFFSQVLCKVHYSSACATVTYFSFASYGNKNEYFCWHQWGSLLPGLSIDMNWNFVVIHLREGGQKIKNLLINFKAILSTFRFLSGLIWNLGPDLGSNLHYVKRRRPNPSMPSPKKSYWKNS